MRAKLEEKQKSSSYLDLVETFLIIISVKSFIFSRVRKVCNFTNDKIVRRDPSYAYKKGKTTLYLIS